MTCEKLFNKACEEKMHGRLENAYELFAEVVHDYPEQHLLYMPAKK